VWIYETSFGAKLSMSASVCRHDAVAVTFRRVPQCQSTVIWCVDLGSVGSLDMARKDMNVPVKDERMEDLTSGRMDPTPRSTTYQ
jgi:hypothetical protein